MPDVKTVKHTTEGGCNDCRARWTRAQVQEMLRHVRDRKHTAWWIEHKELEIRPEGRAREDR